MFRAALIALFVAACSATPPSPSPSPSPTPTPTPGPEDWALRWGGAPAIYEEILGASDCRTALAQLNHWRTAYGNAPRADYMAGYIRAGEAVFIGLGCYASPEPSQ